MQSEAWHTYSVADVLRKTNSDAHTGLSNEEAESRLKEHGANELHELNRRSLFHMLLDQYKDFMVLVLLAATIISALLGEHIDAITIAAIILMNGILGVFQEYRAERSLSALKKMSAPQAKVLRSATRVTLAAADLVPGDILYLETGDRVPADVRWLEVNDVQVDESPLTGESLPVSKTTAPLGQQWTTIGDIRNMSFMGTMVTRGTGTAVVVRTGMSTEMGNIAHLIQVADTMQTPLQTKLAQLGKILIFISLLLTFIVVMAGIIHGQPPYEMFLAGVSLAVAAIPEGLPAIVTVALALGVQRMIRRKAIVRKLPSVETLGSATVICSDKTGTLTENKMTVLSGWANGQRQGAELLLAERYQRLQDIARECNNARWDERQEMGDATEVALLKWLQSCRGARSFGRLHELPFDSERKKMSVLVRNGERPNEALLLFCKGAPEIIIRDCTHLLLDGRAVPFTADLQRKVLAANEQMAGEALRVLGFAYRELDVRHTGAMAPQDEEQMVFVGLLGMMDPPRADAMEAIATCRQAGIETIMITGDHQRTALAIAEQLGLTGQGKQVLTGAELEQMSEKQLGDAVNRTAVFARVAPEHKMRIVKALQQRGHIVAMTGDGVNDAPAIKAADIGIAMGLGGTDVAKEASALVLANDRFSTIVAAVEEGRNIYDNIRKFIRYLLASNVGEIMTMMLAMLMGLPLPLVPIQILWVNLVTDGLPAMALGVDQPEEDLMRRSPRAPRENVFARRLGWKIISRGLAIGVCTLIAFMLTYKTAAHLMQAQTVAFATLVMAQLIHVFDCRSSRSIFHRNILENKPLVIAVLSSVLLLLGVIYIENMQPLFHTVALGLRDWALVLVLAAAPTLLFGIGSLFSSRGDKPRTKLVSGTPVLRR